MSREVNFRPATKNDIPALVHLFSISPRFHRHLDWNPPIEWVGTQPIFLAENKAEGILAALALTPDPPEIAWVRFYACAPGISANEYWQELLNHCIEELSPHQCPLVPALGLSAWFGMILAQSGFRMHQHIVGLQRELIDPYRKEYLNPQIWIRPMEPEDLDMVAQIDREAFEPIWQNSLEQIRLSLQLSLYASVAELDGEIVGFQISTGNMFSTHLARLAVRPVFRGRRIGYTLVAEVIDKFNRDGGWMLTVNTQDNNTASLALYHLLGFTSTSEKYPVYLYHCSQPE